MKTKIKKNRLIIYIILALFFLGIPFIIKFPRNTQADPNTNLNLIQLTDKMILEKTFTPKYDGIDYIAIQFATYGNKQMTGKIKVTIEDKKSKKIIYDKKIELSTVIDNAQHIFKFKKQKNSKNKDYIITIDVLDLPENEMLAIYGSLTDDKKITINDKKEKLNYAVIYGYEKNDIQLLMYFPIYLVVIGFIELLKEDD